MPKQLLEQATLTESVDQATGKILVDIITPGRGSSGFYSPEVCEAAAGLVQPGTQMYLDHPTATEEHERPVRSVKDIAAVFTEAARWDPDRGESGSLVAEAQVIPALVETMKVIQGAIGVSIRGSATDIVNGVVEGLHSIDSVDFVTRAGRGGSFSLMESAQPSRVHARAIAHGVSEATVNDTREGLQTALRDAYTGDKTYVWVRDFDDTTVWFEVEAPEDSGIFAQAYSMSDTSGASLSGDRTEVQVMTTYVPVTRPDSTNPTTEDDQEVTMGNISIEESEHKRLVTEAGRVDALQTENTTLKAENGELKESAAKRDRTDAAATIVVERAKAAEVEFTALESKGLLADLPLKEGALDTDAFTKTVDEAAASKKTAGGAGSVTGFGGTSTPQQSGAITESDLDKAVAGTFGRSVKEA